MKLQRLLYLEGIVGVFVYSPMIALTCAMQVAIVGLALKIAK